MSKLLLLIVAVASAVSVPMAASGQVAPEKPPKDLSGPTYRNEVFVGWGYTSANQVNQSRSGLQGVTGSVKRDFTDHFGVKLDGGYYGDKQSALQRIYVSPRARDSCQPL